MVFKKKALARKLLEMYPEISKYGLDLDLSLDDSRGVWVVTLSKGEHRLSTFLEIKDAEACLQGDRCVYLGLQIGEFVNNFESGEPVRAGA